MATPTGFTYLLVIGQRIFLIHMFVLCVYFPLLFDLITAEPTKLGLNLTK